MVYIYISSLCLSQVSEYLSCIIIVRVGGALVMVVYAKGKNVYTAAQIHVNTVYMFCVQQYVSLHATVYIVQ